MYFTFHLPGTHVAQMDNLGLNNQGCIVSQMLYTLHYELPHPHFDLSYDLSFISKPWNEATNPSNQDTSIQNVMILNHDFSYSAHYNNRVPENWTGGWNTMFEKLNWDYSIHGTL